MKSRKYIIAILIVAVLIVAGFLASFCFMQKDGILPKSESSPVTVADVFHSSYFSQKKVFDDGYARAKTDVKQPAAKAIIVNHHLLASEFIAESFNTIATDAPVTVLLVSPNHFNSGKADVIASSAKWQTPYGILDPDPATVKNLSDAGIASIEEEPFEKEHGVSGIVPFIKKSLPNARVVPVIFRDHMTPDQAKDVADKYYATLPNNLLIVGSFDFSHYLNSRAADFHDTNNLEVLENFDFSKIYNLDTDSRPGLAFFMELLKDYGYQDFHLLENSNSAKLTHSDVLETTSYIDGYYAPGSASTESVYTLLNLPSITSSVVPSQLERSSSDYALTYLERLFYGQDNTFIFVSKPDSQIQSPPTRLGIQIIAQDNRTVSLGPLSVDLVNCENGIADQALVAIDRGDDVALCQGAAKNSVELYKNRPIIYASGELVGDKNSENQTDGLAVGLAFQDHRLKIFLLPIGTAGGQSKLLVSADSEKLLAQMAVDSQIPYMESQIKSGVITMDNFK